MHKILSCASFGSSGSGVVTDYLLEFNGIFNSGDYEFRFLQDYGGVSTLEDVLVHNYHRLNSDIAIQNFMNYVDYQSGDVFSKRYERFFNGQFRKLSYQYLNKLIDAEWKGYWEEYQVFGNKFENALKYKIYPRLLRLLHGNQHYIARYVPRKKMYFSSPTHEYFCQCTKEYIRDLCKSVDPSGRYQYLYFDQLLPPTNINRYNHYFDDLKVIVVDRDPRDYYLENVERWGEGWVPSDVEQFIDVYKGIRNQINFETDAPNILRISFEDAIYNYDSFSEKINEFLGLSKKDHLYPKERFNPIDSAKNTQLWKSRSVDKHVIAKIEEQLGSYCFDFSKYE